MPSEGIGNGYSPGFLSKAHKLLPHRFRTAESAGPPPAASWVYVLPGREMVEEHESSGENEAHQQQDLQLAASYGSWTGASLLTVLARNVLQGRSSGAFFSAPHQ